MDFFCIFVIIHNICFLLVGHSLLKEISFPFQTYHIHPVERVFSVVQLFVPQCINESVGNEFNLIAHQIFIHPNQRTIQRFVDKLFFDFNRTRNDFVNFEFR